MPAAAALLDIVDKMRLFAEQTAHGPEVSVIGRAEAHDVFLCEGDAEPASGVINPFVPRDGVLHRQHPLRLVPMHHHKIRAEESGGLKEPGIDFQPVPVSPLIGGEEQIGLDPR